MVTWNVDLTLRLIQMYKSRSVLWDGRNVNYRNQFHRREALNEISDKLGIDRAEIERKIKNVTCHYLRELRKTTTLLKKNRRPFRSKWFAFKALEFLRDRIEPWNNTAEESTKMMGKLIKSNTRSRSETTTKVNDEPQEISQLSMKCEIETNEDIESLDNGTLELGKPVKIEQTGQVITNNDERAISKDSNNHYTLAENSDTLGGDITGETIGQPVIAAVCTLPNQTTTSSDNNNNNNHDHHHRQTSDRIDEYGLLGEEVAIRIRQLPTKYARCIVQYKIQRLLFEAVLGKYDHPPTGAAPYTLPDNHRFSKTGSLNMHENGSSSCSSAGDISALRAENF